VSIHYDGRRFRPVTNTPNGQVNGKTLFEYRQVGDLLTAVYTGGGIRHGQMTGLVGGDGSLKFCYQHVTDAGELRSGICHSTPRWLPDGRLRLEESWRWTLGELSAGQSAVEEINGSTP
jgi:hypothetical protein